MAVLMLSIVYVLTAKLSGESPERKCCIIYLIKYNI